MPSHVVIAEPYGLVRRGLYSIFADDARVDSVRAVETLDALLRELTEHPADLVVIDQALVTDRKVLPRVPFVMVSIHPDAAYIQMARRQGARGYLTITASLELWRSLLEPSHESFLLDPSLTSAMMDHTLYSWESAAYAMFTSREQEVAALYLQGYSRRRIAEHLHISENTAKSHLSRVRQKMAGTVHR